MAEAEYYKQLRHVDDCPEVHFWHHDGGHIERGRILGGKQGLTPACFNYCTSGQPDKFVIIPVTISDRDEQKSWRNLADNDNINDDGSDLHLQPYVAIAFPREKDKWGYVSCRKSFSLTKSALAEYRSTMGRYEVFELSYSYSSGCYSFKSHNGLYLHYNSSLKTVAFKTKLENEAKWKVQFLKSCDNNTTQNEESVLCLAIVNLHGGDTSRPPFLIAKSTSEDVEFDVNHFDYVTGLLQKLLSEPKRCSCFGLPDVGQRWYVTTDADLFTYIVVTTEEYPGYLATECCEDLSALFQCKYKWENGDKENPVYVNHGKLPSEKQRERLCKEIFATRREYLELKRESDKEVEDKVFAEAKQKMNENFEALLKNQESAESLASKAEELEAQAKIFKKKAKTLKQHMRMKYLSVPALVALGAGAVGGMVGWGVGGPAGAAWLGTQAAEIGVGVGAGVIAGLAGKSAYEKANAFWGNKFVPFKYGEYRLHNWKIMKGEDK